MKKRPSDQLPKMLVRMPKDVKKRLRNTAAYERRSMTAQVIKYIEEGLSRSGSQKEAA